LGFFSIFLWKTQGSFFYIFGCNDYLLIYCININGIVQMYCVDRKFTPTEQQGNVVHTFSECMGFCFRHFWVQFSSFFLLLTQVCVCLLKRHWHANLGGNAAHILSSRNFWLMAFWRLPSLSSSVSRRKWSKTSEP